MKHKVLFSILLVLASLPGWSQLTTMHSYFINQTASVIEQNNVEYFDIIATGQSNMVNRDTTVGTWEYTIDTNVLCFQYAVDTFAVADPALNNISPENSNSSVARNNIAFVFAKAHTAHSANKVRMIVSAYGGENITSWTPVIEAAPDSSNFMLDSLINKLNRAPADFLAKVILWQQGESDGAEDKDHLWGDRLMAVYDTLINHPKVADNAILLVGYVAVQWDSINRTIDSIFTGKRLIGTRHIVPVRYEAETDVDDLHWTNEGIDKIGRAFYSSYFHGYPNYFDQNLSNFNIFRRSDSWPYNSTELQTRVDYAYSTAERLYVGPFNGIDFAPNTKLMIKSSLDQSITHEFGTNDLGAYHQMRDSAGTVRAIIRSYAIANNQVTFSSGNLAVTAGDITASQDINAGDDVSIVDDLSIGGTATGAMVTYKERTGNSRIEHNGNSTGTYLRFYNSSDVQTAIIRSYNSATPQFQMTAGQFNSTFTSTVGYSAALFDGNWYTSGTGTTTKPHILVEPAGASSTAWSTLGTGLGINGASGFVGNLLDLQTNGVPKISFASTGKITLESTVTAVGTTGDQVINMPSGTVNIAAAGSTVTVTNNLVTTNSLIIPLLRSNDTTAKSAIIVPAAGSFTVYLNAAATAEVSVGFIVFN